MDWRTVWCLIGLGTYSPMLQGVLWTERLESTPPVCERNELFLKNRACKVSAERAKANPVRYGGTHVRASARLLWQGRRTIERLQIVSLGAVAHCATRGECGASLPAIIAHASQVQ